MRFIDTNVLLYAISEDPDERAKAQRANEILTSRDYAGVRVENPFRDPAPPSEQVAGSRFSP